jgi:hypothetical protein
MDSLESVHIQVVAMLEGSCLLHSQSLPALAASIGELSSASKSHIMRQLRSVAQLTLHNSSVLSQAEDTCHFVSRLIELYLLSHEDDILDLLKTLVGRCGVRKTHLTAVYRIVREKSPSLNLMTATMQMLKGLLSYPGADDPLNYFYFSGKTQGLRVMQTTPYPFRRNFACCVWIRLERVNDKAQSKLFVMHCAGFGGREAYFKGTSLYLRMLGPEYSYDFPGIFIYAFSPCEWTCLALEHKRSRLGRPTLKAVVNGVEVLRASVPFPVPKTKVLDLTYASLCEGFTGQLVCGLFFKGAVGSAKLKALYAAYTVFGPQSHESLDSLPQFLDKSHLFLLFHPLRTALSVAYEGVSGLHAAIGNGAGVKLTRCCDMTSLGGISGLLPLLEAVQGLGDGEPQLISQWLEVLGTCLRDSPENQQEAYQVGVFKAVAAILLRFDSDAFSEVSVGRLAAIIPIVTPNLREQLIIHLLWNLEIWHGSQAEGSVLRLLSALYTALPRTLALAFGTEQMLDVLVGVYDSLSFTCCAKHNGEGCLDDVIETFSSTIEAAVRVQPQDLKLLINALYMRTAPCLQATLVRTLTRLLQPGGADPAQNFYKAFIEASGAEMLLYLVLSSRNELKALCLQGIEALLRICPTALGKFPSHDLMIYLAAVISPSLQLLEANTPQRDIRGLLDHHEGSPDAIDEMSPHSSELPPRSSSFDRAVEVPRRAIGQTTSDEELSLYTAVLALVLQRPVRTYDMLDSSDVIANREALALLLTIIEHSSQAMQQRLVMDLLMLTKWNSDNSRLLSMVPFWQTWLLSLILGAQAESPTNMLIRDMGSRVHTAVVLQAYLTEETGWRYFQDLVVWVQSCRDTGREPASKVARQLIGSLIEELRGHTAQNHPSLTSALWQNILTSGFLLQELVMLRPAPPTSEAWQLLTLDFTDAAWQDLLLVTAFLDLCEPLWPSELFKGEDPKLLSFHRLELAIKRSSKDTKEDFQLILYEPWEFKARGCFVSVVVQLSGLMLSTASDLTLMSVCLERLQLIANYVLLVSESSKQLPQSAAMTFTHAICYVLGSISCQMDDAQHADTYDLLKGAMQCVLSSVFCVHLLAVESKPEHNSFLWAGPCPHVASLVIQAMSEASSVSRSIDNDEIRRMQREGYEQLQELIERDEWRDLLRALHDSEKEGILSLETHLNLAAQRASSVARVTTDQQTYLTITEAVTKRVQDKVLALAAEASETEAHRRQRAAANAKARARKHRQICTQLKQSLQDPTPQGVPVVSSSIFSSEMARPYLRTRPSKSWEYIGRHQECPLSSPAVTQLQFSALQGCDLLKEVGLVTPLSTRYGYLQLTKPHQLTFTSKSAQQFLAHVHIFQYNPDQTCVKEWSLLSLSQVLPRTYILRSTALELFFADSHSFLFDFSSTEDRAEFMAAVTSALKDASSFSRVFTGSQSHEQILARSGLTEEWVNWRISNFEYLVRLNLIAGRSFHDLTQYPVMPWVLTDFSSASLDLKDPAVYRDLSKPMGALGPRSRTSFFEDRYSSTLGGPEPAFHYGTHYSSPGIVLHYLLRLFPFSEGFKALHDGQFDIPDRLFSSISDTFRSASEDISDVRELIPEFYYLPEFLLNLDDHDFGLTQLGEQVNHVKLPPWASSPYEFVQIMRQALESDFVSARLNEWIDLIFGYKQRGEAATSALNAFYYMTYEDPVDLGQVRDPTLLKAIEAQAVHFGRTPRQLFSRPHPQRQARSRARTVVSKEVALKLYEPGATGLHRELPRNYADLPAQVLLQAALVSDSRIVGVTCNGAVIRYSWAPIAAFESKTPFTLTKDKVTSPLKAIETRDQSLQTYEAPIAITQGGRTIVQGGLWDGSVTISNLDTRTAKSLTGHKSTVTCLDVEGHSAVTGAKDGELVLWTVGLDWTAQWRYAAHTGAVTAVRLCSALHAFASTGVDGRCLLYALQSCRLLMVIDLQHKPIHNCAFAPVAPAKLLLFTPSDQSLSSWSVNGSPLHRARVNSQHIIRPVVQHDLNWKEFLLYGTELGEICIRKVNDMQVMRRLFVPQGAPILSVFVTPDLRFLFATCSTGEVAVLAAPELTQC